MARGISDAIRCADFFRKGNPPVAGGVLDQANWFIEFCDFYWSEYDRTLNELKKKHGSA